MISADLEGRVALVTGGAGDGIGLATVRRLADDGATVVVVDSHPRRVQEVVAKLALDYDDRVHGFAQDITDFAGVNAVLATIAAELGPVRILVNNAAVNVIGPLVECAVDDWEAVLRVNLTAPWYLCRSLIPGMAAAGGGSIVNISSLAAEVGYGWEAPYGVSKAGLQALTRACAHEGGPRNVRSNAVTMGMVTGTKSADAFPHFLEESKQRQVLESFPQPEDIAEAVAYLASERSRHVTGEILNVSSGWYMRT